MRVWLGAFGLAGAAVGSLFQGSSDQWTVAVSGDTLGYLSPCGCTYPMAGGIQRKAGVVRGERVLFVDNGSIVRDLGRQSEMKAETVAQAWAAAGVDAINLTPIDAQLGKGAVLSIARLSGGKLIATQLGGSELELPRWLEEGPFLIGGATTKPAALGLPLGVTAQPLTDAVSAFSSEAFGRSKTAVLLLDGSLEEARRLAAEFPTLAMVVYRVVGDPPGSPEREGQTLLVTPGDRGRSLVKLAFGDVLQGYQVEHLGPEHGNDPAVSQIYRTYLKRVDASDLLERQPRFPGMKFSGSSTCMSCHAGAAKVWRASEHAHALATLEKEGHSRDPDCVKCHVVGLSLTTGFKSRRSTPQLSDVGCESCHGAGAAHSYKPRFYQMQKIGERACLPCHTTENSPRFNYAEYWKRIKH